MELPERVENVIHCKNPRCITVTENYVRPVFKLINREKAQYACEYCDALYTAGSID
jgi:aspartate carbamoyltransferase regulatory subunit